jgi:CubicO group peptidase (beta-lactamase class C family)
MVLSLQSVRQVDEIVARTQVQGRSPSVVAAVIRGGQVAYVSAAGDHAAAGRDTQFRIGSITKTLTAAVVLGLRDEGRLHLDDRLTDHLPETGLDAVRLRQLLCHAAGLQREPDGAWWERSPGVPLENLLEAVTAAKLAFDPYARFHYSNLAYGLLGGVVERLTGQPWWDAVQVRLLGPLGMSRTTYHAAEPYARGYVVHPWHQTVREEPRTDTAAMAPAGQLWSTVDDLGTFAAALVAEDPPVLTRATIAQMASPAVISDPDGWTTGYGLGLQLWRRGERVFVGHTGSMPGYLGVLAAHRPSGTAAVGFANTYGLRGMRIGDLGLSIVEAVLECEPEPAPTPWRPLPVPPDDVADLCGRWWWMSEEIEAHWDAAAGELVLTEPDRPEWRFARSPDDSDQWRGRSGEQVGEVLRVRRGSDGTASALDIATFVYTRDAGVYTP